MKYRTIEACGSYFLLHYRRQTSDAQTSVFLLCNRILKWNLKRRSCVLRCPVQRKCCLQVLNILNFWMYLYFVFALRSRVCQFVLLNTVCSIWFSWVHRKPPQVLPSPQAYCAAAAPAAAAGRRKQHCVRQRKRGQLGQFRWRVRVRSVGGRVREAARRGSALHPSGWRPQFRLRRLEHPGHLVARGRRAIRSPSPRNWRFSLWPA